MKIAVVGAGLIGRLIALELLAQGHDLTFFDKDTKEGHNGCTWQGGGMLTPWAELDVSESEIFNLGVESLKIWPQILSKLSGEVYFKNQGSLVVAHSRDYPDLKHFAHRLQGKLQQHFPQSHPQDEVQWLSKNNLLEVEPELTSRFEKALYLPFEGQIDNRELMSALESTLLQFSSLTWCELTEVISVKPYQVELKNNTVQKFDSVIDTRGLGAKKSLESTHQLRGVKGEIIWLHAPEVKLSRPVRVMHPKTSIYIIPRRNQRFLIGATSIENEQPASVTVQSALELLSAAFTVHSGFAEAQILEMNTQYRPAYADHLPKIINEPGLLSVNGLYRNGFLISPKLCELSLKVFNNQAVESYFERIVSPSLVKA